MAFCKNVEISGDRSYIPNKVIKTNRGLKPVNRLLVYAKASN